MRTRTFLAAAALLTLAACQNAPAPTQAATSPATTQPAVKAGDDFCRLAKAKGGENLLALDADDTTPEQFRQVLANLDTLAAAAPAEIHADFAAVITFEHQLFGNDGNLTGQMSADLAGGPLHTAMQNVASYLDKHCGIHP